jgi:EmrB/QacA subfamily drug resistance transporter
MSSATPAPCDALAAQAAAHQATPHPRATLAATILGSSVAFIDGSVVNVALPALARDLGAGPAGLAWAINAYLLPLGALILLGGAAGDRFGRRRLFLAGLAIFLIASLFCAAAPSLAAFLAGRALQGVGAACLMPNSLAILGAAFTGEARGRAIGTWAAAGAIAGALGPRGGGGRGDAAGWRTIFLLNLPVGAGAAWLARIYVAESHDQAHGAALDWRGAATATLGLGLVTWALTAAAEPGASSILAVAGGFGLALLGGFLWIEARAGTNAMMPVGMFATASFAGVTILTFFLYAALGGLLVLLPFLLIRIEGWSAVAAGAALLPLPAVIGLGSRAMGQVAAKIGGRLPLALGAATVALGFALFLRVGETGLDYWTDVLPATLVVALGMGLSVAPLTTTVMSSVDADHVGAASGFNSAVARIGGLIATALLGFVFAEAASAESFVAGFRVAAIVGAVSAGVAAIAAFVLIAPPPREVK